MTCARRATAHAARLAMAAACRPTAIDSMTTRRVSDLAAATIPRFARGGRVLLALASRAVARRVRRIDADVRGARARRAVPRDRARRR